MSVAGNSPRSRPSAPHCRKSVRRTEQPCHWSNTGHLQPADTSDSNRECCLLSVKVTYRLDRFIFTFLDLVCTVVSRFHSGRTVTDILKIIQCHNYLHQGGYEFISIFLFLVSRVIQKLLDCFFIQNLVEILHMHGGSNR